MSFFIDLKKKKNTTKKKRLNLLKKIKMTKIFYKQIRKNIFIRKELNIKQQFKKSKLIYSNFNKKSDPNYIYSNTVLYTLLVLKLFLNLRDAKKYIQTIGLYVNSVLIKDPFFILNVNDVFSLNCDFNFFFYLQFMRRNLRKYFKKVKPRIFKLIRGKIDINKQSSKSYPKWVYKFSSFKEIKPVHIEYDYVTLTFFVIFNNKYPLTYNYNYNAMLTIYLYRLYNWKYIV